MAEKKDTEASIPQDAAESGGEKSQTPRVIVRSHKKSTLGSQSGRIKTRKGALTAQEESLRKTPSTVSAKTSIPQKTKMEHANTVRVPLNQKAREILERYKDLENALLPRFSHFGYNKKIKEILKYVGIDRKVIVLDPKTREDVARPLYEVASTHTARKTFIGNLYRQVKDPNLIASMSGHSEGSRAFARYRKIDDEMKKELVNLLD